MVPGRPTVPDRVGQSGLRDRGALSAWFARAPVHRCERPVLFRRPRCQVAREGSFPILDDSGPHERNRGLARTLSAVSGRYSRPRMRPGRPDRGGVGRAVRLRMRRCRPLMPCHAGQRGRRSTSDGGTRTPVLKPDPRSTPSRTVPSTDRTGRTAEVEPSMGPRIERSERCDGRSNGRHRVPSVVAVGDGAQMLPKMQDRHPLPTPRP